MNEDLILQRIATLAERISLMQDQSGYSGQTECVLYEAYIDGLYAEMRSLEKALKEHRVFEGYAEYL